MTRIKQFLVTASLLVAAAAARAVPTLDLDPAGGNVSATPGLTTGWGFRLVNDTDHYLLVTGTQFNLAPLSAFGEYRDLLAAVGLSFVIAPHSGLTQAYSHAAGTGLGEFDVAATAVGQWPGSLEVDYALFSVDPNLPGFDPAIHTIALDVEAFADATVSAVPEPATALLSLLGLVGLAGAVTRRR
jgi:PEP-CTERM motif